MEGAWLIPSTFYPFVSSMVLFTGFFVCSINFILFPLLITLIFFTPLCAMTALHSIGCVCRLHTGFFLPFCMRFFYISQQPAHSKISSTTFAQKISPDNLCLASCRCVSTTLDIMLSRSYHSTGWRVFLFHVSSTTRTQQVAMLPCHFCLLVATGVFQCCNQRA